MNKIIIAALMVLVLSAVGSAQKNGFDPGSKQIANLDSIEFSIPNGFDLTLGPALAITKGPRSNGQFVATVVSANSAQIERLAREFTELVLPDEEFTWKAVSPTRILRKSSAQTDDGEIKGLGNNGSIVGITYTVLSVKGKVVVVGTGYKLKADGYAKEVFANDRPAGMSIPDLAALTHVITSITGEPFQTLFPGVFVTVRPN